MPKSPPSEIQHIFHEFLGTYEERNEVLFTKNNNLQRDKPSSPRSSPRSSRQNSHRSSPQSSGWVHDGGSPGRFGAGFEPIPPRPGHLQPMVNDDDGMLLFPTSY